MTTPVERYEPRMIGIEDRPYEAGMYVSPHGHYVLHSAYAELAAVPAGYALVPVEPTTAMKCRAVEAWEGPAAYKSVFARGLADLEDKAAECWAAMLAASKGGGNYA